MPYHGILGYITYVLYDGINTYLRKVDILERQYRQLEVSSSSQETLRLHEDGNIDCPLRGISQDRLFNISTSDQVNQFTG